MTSNKLVKRIAGIGVLVLILALAIGFGISVAVGNSELGLVPALVFVLQALVVIVPLVIVLGALPLLVVVFSSHKKKRGARENIEKQ